MASLMNKSKKKKTEATIRLGDAMKHGDIWSKLSYLVMGLSNIRRGQIGRGFMFLFLELCFIVYMIMTGINALAGLLTLGTKQAGMVYDEAQGIYIVQQGDNSMLMLLSGVVALVVIVFFLIVWNASVKSGEGARIGRAQGHRLPGFKDDIRSLFDKNIHGLLLAVPMTGLVVFTVMPLIYMILMAFTNYDATHQPPGNLFTWIGLDNFNTLLFSTGTLAKTFWPILGWTLIWAVFATFSNYFLGIFLAVLINQKNIRFKKVWRTTFVLTVAIPSFVSLMVMRTMLNKFGIVNTLLDNLGFITSPLPFFTNPTWARATVIIVNMWIGIPITMLLATGILSNIPAELYESAKIDGAGAITIFRKITFPYVLFVTTPYLISNFVANVNNFNPIFFLTGGGPSSLAYFKGAGKTDLLVTWLYKLTTESKDYCYASAIGIVIFMISAVLSLIVYRRTSAYKDEGGFQ